MFRYAPYLPALLMDFCLGTLITNTSFFSSYLNLSSTFVGLLMATSAAFFVGFAIPFGRLSDRIGRTRILLTACLLISVISFALSFCQTGFQLILIFPCVGLSQALFWPTYEAWLTERKGGGSLIKRLMTFNLFWCVGMTIGPVISSYLQGESSSVLPFYCAGAGGLANWGIIWFCSRVKSRNSLTDDNIPYTIPPKSQHVFLNIARISNFASYFSLGVLRNLGPKLTREMGVAPKLFGNLMLLMGLVQMVTFSWFGSTRSTQLHYRIFPLIAIQLSAIIGFLGMWTFQNASFWIPSFGVIGLCAATTYFSSLYYSLHNQQERGDKSGWHEAILGCGVLLGPCIGGGLDDLAKNHQSPYLLCAVVIGACVLAEIVVWERSRRISGEK